MKSKVFILVIAVFAFGCGAKNVFAEIMPGALYVPLIGITSVPDPLALPLGAGSVTYHYAVKNFLQELPLTDVKVVDDKCGPVIFITGDDNNDSKLDYSETWRYICATKIFTTTQSVATATGISNGITANHSAYATVVVGSNNPPPLVSIVNITKIAYPLSLPIGGGSITFTYKVNNPGVAPLSDIVVIDDKCKAMSGKLGDTNGNGLLDPNEVWIYTCVMNLRQTTTNTVMVTAFANGLKAINSATIAIKVDIPDLPDVGENTNFPDVGSNPDLHPNFKIAVWEVLSGILAILIIFFVLTRKNKLGENQKKP